jgi:hypothetical protein
MLRVLLSQSGLCSTLGRVEVRDVSGLGLASYSERGRCEMVDSLRFQLIHSNLQSGGQVIVVQL